MLCQVQDDSEADFSQQDKPPHFPIRALAFDEEERALYSADEMGFVIKWDITGVIDKLEMIGLGIK